jgi:hypothetical protein
MEPEVKRAFFKAGAKLGIGLSLLAAVIGIRILTATAPGIESGIEELDRLGAQMAREATQASSDRIEAGTRSGEGDRDPDSLGSRMNAALRGHFPGSVAETHEGEKLVSCDLNGRMHFMRADDCASRGGRSTVFSDDR